VHVTAGFGDIGFCGQWTLEISVIKPIKIYSRIECCQIYYNTIHGDIINYNGKYQKAKEIQGSKIYQEFKKGSKMKRTCPNCGAHDGSYLAESDGYIYHSICLTCGYELTLKEKVDQRNNESSK
jgi:hypothetical protein